MMGLPSIVRIQDAFYHLAAKPLDMGADGIMVPRTETVEQLKAVIDGLCFHPVGRKGNGGNLQFYPGESIEHFNSTRILMPQIESPRGIANLPATNPAASSATHRTTPSASTRWARTSTGPARTCSFCRWASMRRSRAWRRSDEGDGHA